MAQANSMYEYLQQHNALSASESRIGRELNTTQQLLSDPKLTQDQKDSLHQKTQDLKADRQQVKTEKQSLEHSHPAFEQERSGKNQSNQQSQSKSSGWDRANNGLAAVGLGVVAAVSPMQDKAQDLSTKLSAPDHSQDFKDKVSDLAGAVTDQRKQRQDAKDQTQVAQQAHSTWANTPAQTVNDPGKKPDFQSKQQSSYQYNAPQVSYQSLQKNDGEAQRKTPITSLMDNHKTDYANAVRNETRGDGLAANQMASDKMLKTLDKQAGNERDLSKMDPGEKTQLMKDHLKSQYGKAGEDAFGKVQQEKQHQQDQQKEQQKDQQAEHQRSK